MTPSDTDLARELRAIRPEIDQDFAAELDAWAAEGFPSTQDLAKRGARAERAPRLAGLLERFQAFRARPLMPALTAAAAVILAFTVAVGIQSATNDGVIEQSRDIGGDFPFESAPTGEAGGSGRTSKGTAQVAPAAGDESVALPECPNCASSEPLKPGEDRIQEKTASMTLSADADEVRQVADDVVDVVDRYDGIVVNSNVTENGDRARAVFDLRIPSQNLEAALADLSDLASVQARSDGVADITAPFVSAEERFDDAKATVDSLVASLAATDSAAEIASIREQLRTARPELATARSELANLKQRAEFSRVSVTVVGDGDADGWSIGDAVDDAGNVLESIGGALLVALAAIVPLGLLSLVLWFAATRLRRRRRERALDES